LPNTLQEFLIRSTQNAAKKLEAAVLQLPEDRRNWSPMGNARTALNMVAECAILGATTADMIRNRAFPADFDRDAFDREKQRLANDWPALQVLLHENNQKAIAEIATVPDDALWIEVAMPWGTQTLAEIMAYPYWNMSYHEGQINYIASMLET